MRSVRSLRDAEIIIGQLLDRVAVLETAVKATSTQETQATPPVSNLEASDVTMSADGTVVIHRLSHHFQNGGLGICFTDRGNPSSVDKVASGFVQGVWTDWNLSSIVPAGATVVLLRVVVYNSSGVWTVGFRKNGHTGANMSQVSGIINTLANTDLIVACDVSRIIEYYVLPGTYSSLDVTVAGWG